MPGQITEKHKHGTTRIYISRLNSDNNPSPFLYATIMVELKPTNCIHVLRSSRNTHFSDQKLSILIVLFTWGDQMWNFFSSQQYNNFHWPCLPFWFYVCLCVGGGISGGVDACVHVCVCEGQAASVAFVYFVIINIYNDCKVLWATVRKAGL